MAGSKVQRGGVARTAKDLKRLHKRPCRSAPAAPTGVTVTFVKRENKTGEHWDARVKWNATTLDVAGRPINIEGYQVKLRATDASGVPVQVDGADHDYWRQRVEDDDRRVRFQDLPRPKTYYYQAAVRTLNRIHGGRCWSAWSAWTTATQATTGATPGPPAPTGVTLTFDKVEGARRRPWRARSRWNEVPQWTPTDGDPVEGAAGYHVQLQVSNDGGTTTANTRRATVEGEAISGTQQHTWGNIRRVRSYRTRVRAYDEYGRKGAFSSWTTWAQPAATFTSTVQNLTWSNPTPSTLVAKWDEPADPSDVDRYKVVVVRNPGTNIVDTGYTTGTRWRYHIPLADRNNNHRVRVTPVLEELHTERDDAAGSYQAETLATQVETTDTANTATLPVDTITTGTLPASAVYSLGTGAIVTGAEPDARAVMDGQGFRTYPPGTDQAETFYADSTTGAVFVHGTFSFGQGQANPDSTLDLKNLTASGFQTPALVQQKDALKFNTSSAVLTWPSATRSGSSLVMFVTIYDAAGAGTISTPSGWTQAATVLHGDGLHRESCFYLANGAGGRTSETVSYTAATDEAQVLMFEYSGVVSFDKVASNSGTSTSASTGTTATTTQADELWIGAIANRGGAGQTSPTNGFVLVATRVGLNIEEQAYAKNVTATGTASFGVTLGSSQAWTGIIATFRASTAAATAATPPAGYVTVYAKDNASGDSHLAFKGDDGRERMIASELAAARTTQLGDAGTAEALITSVTIPANYLKAGTSFRLRAFGLLTTDAAPGTSTWRIRFGTTTLTGTVLDSQARAEGTSQTDGNMGVEAYFTCRTTGATGTAIAGMLTTNGNNVFGQLLGASTGASTTINTTVENLLELTYQTSDAGTNARWELGTVELVKA